MTNGDRVEDAFSRFEMLERRVDEAEGRADALGLGYKKSLDEEIAELQAADKVADELAALKAAQGRSEEHTSELQSLMRISYAVFCLKKKNNKRITTNNAHDKQE